MKNTIVFIKGKPLQNENKNKWNIQREHPFRAFIALIW